jgi:hypothetical protein
MLIKIIIPIMRISMNNVENLFEKEYIIMAFVKI